MTDKAALIALAEKLSAATEPSRQLDLSVAQAVDAAWSYVGEPPRVVTCAAVTFNTEHALTLRPPGWVLTGLSDGTLDVKYHDVRALTCWRAGLAPVGAVIRHPDDVGKMVSATGATPALALSAACLMALAA